MVNWARMVLKPRKSRSLFIYKGEEKMWGLKYNEKISQQYRANPTDVWGRIVMCH